MPSHQDEAHLKHIYDAASKVVNFAQGHTQADFDNDEMFEFTVVQLLKTISEEARIISENPQALRSEAPWKQIATIRERLIYAHFYVNSEIVWKIITTDLPVLLDALIPLRTEYDLIVQAHQHSIRNREEITNSEMCGCFYCLAIFRPEDISIFIKERGGTETALCPQCGIDSVIGSASSYSITKEFLSQMYRYYF